MSNSGWTRGPARAGVEIVAAISIGLPSEPRVFTLSEVEELFPLVNRITARAFQALQPIRSRMERMVPTDPRLPALEREYATVIQRWQSNMERLGAVVKGLWLVDFDTGDGYLCWRYPELRIGHYHGYDTAFAVRRPLESVVEEFDPDWMHS